MGRRHSIQCAGKSHSVITPGRQGAHAESMEPKSSTKHLLRQKRGRTSLPLSRHILSWRRRSKAALQAEPTYTICTWRTRRTPTHSCSRVVRFSKMLSGRLARVLPLRWLGVEEEQQMTKQRRQHSCYLVLYMAYGARSTHQGAQTTLHGRDSSAF